MNRVFILLFFFQATSATLYAQEMIPNGSFEQYSACPTDYNQIDHSWDWLNPATGIGSPDYFHTCGSGQVSVPVNGVGHQQPYSGNAYAGIYIRSFQAPDIREYIETPLSSPLLAGLCYHFTMQVNLANVSRYTCSNVGAYFSNSLVTTSSALVLPYTPQIINTTGFIDDTLMWVEVSGDYTAIGGEQYLTIGNFNDDASSSSQLFNLFGSEMAAYILIDEVSLTPCNNVLQPEAFINAVTTKICPGDCISFDNSSTNATNYEWFFVGANTTYATDAAPSNICYPYSGTYDVMLVAHNGPYSDTAIASNLIEVFTSPAPVIIQSNDTLYATGSPTNADFQWYLNGDTLVGFTNDFCIPSVDGSYTVEVISEDGCTGTDALAVGMSSFETPTLRLFPNPADESVTLFLTSPARITMYNAYGQIILSADPQAVTKINTHSFPRGIYFINVLSAETSYTQALYVEHK